MNLLSSSLRLARIRGVDIRFHFSMLFSIPIAYWLFRPTNVREIGSRIFVADRLCALYPFA